MSFDYKKEYKEFYMPPKKPTIITVPPMNYIAVQGQGDPNAEDGEYDVSEIAWEAYRLMYEDFFDFFDNEKEGKNNNRPYLDYHFTYNGKKLSISLFTVK